MGNGPEELGRGRDIQLPLNWPCSPLPFWLMSTHLYSQSTLANGQGELPTAAPPPPPHRSLCPAQLRPSTLAARVHIVFS